MCKRWLFCLALISAVVAGCYTEAPVSLPESAEIGLIPRVTPNREQGHVLYEENCVDCHGPEGHGDGWRVKEIEGSPPRDFHSDRTMGRMSPAQAYLAITQGVPKTSMTSFGLMAATDRWHLAFYVISLAHSKEAADRGKVVFQAEGLEQPSARSLSGLGNMSILKDLQARGQSAESARDALAYLRYSATYENHDAGLTEFREGVSQSIAAYRRGEHEKASEILATNYLDTLDSQLMILRSRSSGLSLAIELEVHALLKSFSEGLPVGDIETHAQRLAASLDLAAPLLVQTLSTGSGAAQGASFTLSYGLDGALSIFLLLILSMRRGADRRERKVIVLGLLVGGIASVAATLGLGGMVSGHLRATITLLVSLSVVLLAVPLLAGLVRHFRRPPQTRSVLPPSGLLLLFLLSASLLIRDTLEIVPPIRLMDGYTSSVWIGALGAVVVLLVLVGLLVSMERRLQVSARTALLAISTTSVAIVAAGSAVRAAQQLEFLSSAQAGSMQSPWLSLWPTSQGILFQLIIAALCTAVLVVTTTLKRSR